jgi:hypothetical protein
MTESSSSSAILVNPGSVDAGEIVLRLGGLLSEAEVLLG